MRKTTHKQFVHNNLEMMFATIRHTNQSEREVSTTIPVYILYILLHVRCSYYCSFWILFLLSFSPPPSLFLSLPLPLSLLLPFSSSLPLCSSLPLSSSLSKGCAIGTGFAASSHLDIVAEKLENVTKQDMVKKSKGFFGFGKVLYKHTQSIIIIFFFIHCRIRQMLILRGLKLPYCFAMATFPSTLLPSEWY